ncbi:MAG TPA: hypothetical protein VF510_24480 [Ktedonobacterales bacterium]
MTLAQGQHRQISVQERERTEQFKEERRYIVKVPVAPYYALLVGLALLPLGVLGLIPQLTRGGVLLGFMRITPVVSVIFILTGIGGIAAFAYKRGHYAHHFTLILTGVYLLLFSSNNIAFGNAEGASGGPPNIPWIIENALLAGLMLSGALVTGLATLQRGDRATAREFQRRYGITVPDTHAGHTIRFRLSSSSHDRLQALVDRVRRGATLMALTIVIMECYPIIARSLLRRKIESDAGHSGHEERQ